MDDIIVVKKQLKEIDNRFFLLVFLTFRLPLSGAFIANKRQFITAAHCVYKRFPFMLKAIAGIKDLQDVAIASKTYEVKSFVVHPNYYHTSRKVDEFGDIAVVNIKGEFDFTDPHIKPACIDKSLNRMYNMLIAAGWGYVRPTRVVNGQTQNNRIARFLKIAEFDQQNP